MRLNRFRVLSIILAAVLLLTFSTGIPAYADKGGGGANGRHAGEGNQDRVRLQLKDADECEGYCNCAEYCDCVCDKDCDCIPDRDRLQIRDRDCWSEELLLYIDCDGTPDRDRDRLQKRDQINCKQNIASDKDCDGTGSKDRDRLRIYWFVSV